MILLIINTTEKALSSASEKLPSYLIKAVNKYLNDSQNTDRPDPTKNNERIEPKL